MKKLNEMCSSFDLTAPLEMWHTSMLISNMHIILKVLLLSLKGIKETRQRLKKHTHTHFKQ